MPSMNVYIPEDLYERMKAFDLKWSRIASEAFKSAIQLEATMEIDVAEANLVRLRASRDANQERRRAEGIAIGKKWALESAEYDDIARIAEIAGEPLDSRDTNDAVAYFVGAVLLDQKLPSWPQVEAKLEAIFGRKKPTAAEVRGFVEGVCEIIDKVDKV